MNREPLWTPEEDDRLIELRLEGVPLMDLHKHLPHRTKVACWNRATMIGATASLREYQSEKPEKLAACCDALRDATIYAIMRFGNDNHLNVDEAAALLLSGKPVDNGEVCEVNASDARKQAA